MTFWFGLSISFLLVVLGLFIADISGINPLTDGTGPALLIVPAGMVAALALGAFIAHKSAGRAWISQGMVVLFGVALAGVSWTYRSLITTEETTQAAQETVALLRTKAGPAQIPLQPAPSTRPGLISVDRGAGGHFWVNAAVNGTHVRFLVDTGASNIALTRGDALRLGFNWKELEYPQTAQTPNGPVGIAPVVLDEVRVGGITINNLKAAVVNSEAGQSLLGMNFLQQLQQFEIRGDVLIMRQ